MMIRVILFCASVCISPYLLANTYDPVGLLLTWEEDPSTTMTIDWHTLPNENRPSVVQFRERGRTTWRQQSGISFPFPFSDRTIHRVQLTGLRPDTLYRFRFGEDSRTFSFRTMPVQLRRPFRFVVGGDIFIGERARQMNRQAASLDPEFIVWGGDLAYDDARASNVHITHQWFNEIKQWLIRPDGRVIPVLAAIGNHEVRGFFYWHEGRGMDYPINDTTRRELAPYFFGTLAFPGQPGYAALDFGDYLSLLILDTDHVNPVDGVQTRWLRQRLEEREVVPHVFPVYHVPAFPSVRSYDEFTSKRVRDNWVPLFERHGLTVAFEHHDHAYKRTKPILREQVNPNGIVYMGDGAWGVELRRPKRVEETWFLEKAEARSHLILVTLDGERQTFQSIDHEGQVFDGYATETRHPPLLITDAFDYPEGDLHGASNSLGWGGPWRSIYFETAQVTSEGKMTFEEGGFLGGAGKRAAFVLGPGGPVKMDRQFAGTLQAEPNRPLWLSMLAKIPTNGSESAIGVVRHGQSVLRIRAVEANRDGEIRWEMRAGNLSASIDSSAMMGDTAFLMVRIDTDAIQLWVNPLLGIRPPAEHALRLPARVGAIDGLRLESLALNGSDEASPLLVDEVRIGRSWQSVAEWQPKTFLAWRNIHLGVQPPMVRETAYSDPVGNELPYLLRYAFGIDTGESDHSGLPILELPENGAAPDTFFYAFSRREGLEDVSFRLEQSKDLETWRTVRGAETQVESIGGGKERVLVRLSLTDPQMFFRLQVIWEEQP